MSRIQLTFDGIERGEAPPGAPVGLRFDHEAMSAESEASLLDAIDSRPWISSMSRRVQHYGWRYDYRARRVTPGSYLGPLPRFLDPLLALVRTRHELEPDQAIVNEYLPGQGIAPHVDCEPCFGPVIAMIGLGSDVQMDFRHLPDDRSWTLRFDRRGLLVIADAARSEWSHSIAKRRADRVFGIERSRRVSVTLRRVTAPAESEG